MQTYGYAVDGPTDKLHFFEFQRRNVGDNDVHVDILYTGICHSDIHQARNEWGTSKYPMVPGHEIVGKVIGVGKNVTRFKVGDFAGIGCMVDSCKECSSCKDQLNEVFCAKGRSETYNSFEQDKKTPTYGGYSNQIVVLERFVCTIDPKFQNKLAAVAPLLCAGITTYAPLFRFRSNVEKGKKVAIAGLGGLGHMGVKIAVAMGAEVTVLSTSSSKEEDARRLGAHHFINTKDNELLKSHAGKFDLLLDTISATHSLETFVSLVGVNGVVVLVGAPSTPYDLHAFSLISNNRIVAGSLIGSMKETQEMLDFCAQHDIVSDIELVNVDQLEEAYERAVKSDVKYRFVIDIQSLKDKIKK